MSIFLSFYEEKLSQLLRLNSPIRQCNSIMQHIGAKVPVLILPPPQFIADNQEIPKQVLVQAQTMQKNYLTTLGISANATTENKGSYMGTQTFPWSEKYNGILLTTFIYQKGAEFKKEWMNTATLLRQDDCAHLGSLWNFNDKSVIPFPIENSSQTLPDFLTRTFDNKSPVKINLQTQMKDKRYAEILNLAFMEEFSSKKVQIISNVGRIYCKAVKFNEVKIDQKTNYPAKPHRLLNIGIVQDPKNNSVVQVNSNLQLSSAVFGQNVPKFNEKKEGVDFEPQKIASEFAQKTIPTLDDLSQQEFKIIRRYGSWVYLNRGRAYGLTVGLRLVGGNGAKLHIIRYAPYFENEFDVSIAFIRHEDQNAPLKEGDIVKLDQTLYPK